MNVMGGLYQCQYPSCDNYSVAKCYKWGNWVKHTEGSPHDFLQCI